MHKPVNGVSFRILLVDKCAIYRRGLRSFIETAISNTGTGINNRTKKKVFEKFVQSQNFLTREVDGLGLGLAVAKNIVKSHGGKISIDSAYKNGTRVTFLLPV